VRRLSAVQLDSIATVERSHRLVLAARVGDYPRQTITRLLGAGRVFEYWAHEACLLPIQLYPYFRPKMAVGGRWGSYVRALREHADLVPHVLAEVRERGPLLSRDFDHDGPREPGMWSWKPAKRVLEALWDRGELAIAGRPSFQRLYELTERVIPAEQLARTVPSDEEVLCDLAVRAVEARGVLTEAAIREHWRWKGGAKTLRPHLDALVEDGRLRELEVEDGGSRVYVPPAAELDRPARNVAVLLSPFDNLLWDRPLVERLFGFRHVIEVYKREHERVYGYYVMPFLHRDRLVGRADLKTDRAAGLLRLKSFHIEPGVRRSAALDDALDRALARLARAVGAEKVTRR
jgi:uncharacterized protein